MQTGQLHNSALAYTQMGLAVFPLKPKEKLPATPHGFKNAATDLEQIDRWWTGDSQHNIGIATGLTKTGSYLVVLDLDNKNGKNGIKAFEDLELKNIPIPETLKCYTPSGGKHIYLLSPTPIKSGIDVISEGIDIRCEGGYVVAPPSVLSNGEYKWIQSPGVVGIAEIPDWLLTQIQFAQSGGKATQTFSMPDEIPEGQRTTTLVKLIGSQQAKGLSDEAIRAAVTVENETRCNPPLSYDELEKQVFPALSRWTKGLLHILLTLNITKILRI